MTSWYVDLDGEECGPLTLEDLRDLAADGTLTADLRVRKEGTSVWIPAGRVAGLFPNLERAGTQPRGGAGASAAAAPPKRRRQPAKAQPAWWNRRLSRRQALIFAPLALVLCLGLVVGFRWILSVRLFPASAWRPITEADPDRSRTRLEKFGAPIEREPSIPGLERGEPQLVPGLETVDPAYSPCLSADLKIIVFAHFRGETGSYDLCMATRETVDEPFGPVQPIASTVTRELEAYPALSPDGLELVFIRSHQKPKLFYARRSSRSAAFGPSEPCRIPVTFPEDARLGVPQFIDRKHVKFQMGQQGPKRTRKPIVYLCERSGAGPTFSSVRPMPFSNPWPPYWISGDMLRAYGCHPQGLLFAVRSDPDQPFGIAEPMMSAEKSGPFDGTIWLAPREDVVFYCSPGPGNQLGTSRRLWMIRY